MNKWAHYLGGVTVAVALIRLDLVPFTFLFCLASVFAANLPDFDMRAPWNMFLKHRGVSHNWFAWAILSVVAFNLGELLGSEWAGAGLGLAVGVASHLLLDLVSDTKSLIVTAGLALVLAACIIG